MSSKPSSVTLRTQAPTGAPYLFSRLRSLLQAPGLRRFRATVAYARWDGMGLIAPDVEAVLDNGVEFQALYGVANGVTTPDCLLYSLYLQKLFSKHTYAGAVEDKFANATFHPKLFEFRFRDRLVALVGSANLTGAGLSRNVEANVEVECAIGSDFGTQLDAAWDAMRGTAQEVTLDLIRDLRGRGDLDSEQGKNETPGKKAGKPYVKTGVAVSPKPLFAKVLDIQSPRIKAKILAGLDSITTRPDVLYLEILAKETGAQSGAHNGYQIQLPVATLATFFGVGPNQKKLVTFHFGTEPLVVHLTHFENNTHRVRLRPVRDIPRPAIVIFRRLSDTEYRCEIVPSKNYKKVLASNCTEQSRAGARRWGME